MNVIEKPSEIKNLALVDGEWCPSKPVKIPWRNRIKAAWLVLKGEYAAIKWY